jgi:uncharacterized membrane protein YkgB
MFKKSKKIMARTQGMFVILAATSITFILPWISSPNTGTYIDKAIHPLVCTHEITQEPIDGFSYDLTLQIFT